MSILIAFSKVSLKFGCRKGTCYGLILSSLFWKSLGSSFLGKLVVKSIFVRSLCGIRLTGLLGVRWFGFCEGYGYGEKS